MWAYLSDDLQAPDTGELEQHLGACRRCCGELEFSRELRSRVARTEPERMPPQVREQVERLLEDTQPGESR